MNKEEKRVINEYCEKHCINKSRYITRLTLKAIREQTGEAPDYWPINKHNLIARIFK